MDSPTFSLNSTPEIRFGPGRVRLIAEDALSVGDPDRPVVLIVDGTLLELGIAEPVVSALSSSGADITVFSDIEGEPKQRQVEAATELVRNKDAGLVIAMGGGSAMDIGKIAATVARMGNGPAEYAMQGLPLPKKTVPKICVPTTSGTGSEFSSTNIFTNTAGKKVWVWGTETKPERVILDPELTLSLPPDLTAWTGLDAFSHALESCTNVNRHRGNDFYAHKALSLISEALRTAVQEPGNLSARADMALGSAYAGIALDNCSTAMAHNISHALAALAPVHHGLATGLAIEVILGWQVERDTGPFAAAAAACGLGQNVNSFPGWYGNLLTDCGVMRKLPEAFKGFSASDLAAEMRTPETTPMRETTARRVGEADVERFAEAMMAMA
ncbi:MAG: iron-containing alcohol dehydrogenase [Rhodospirillaceae bacterium]|nr:iron-containing alcohol dehydrogenase [Rhodospirillaceae bacterium]